MKCLPFVFAVIALCVSSCTRSTSQQHANQLNEPISLTLNFDSGSVFDIDQGPWRWTLEVFVGGAAELTIHNYPSQITRSFTVTASQFEELNKVLAAEKFFDLNSEYGQRVPDASSRTITIACGNDSMTVKIEYLTNWLHNDPGRLREPARAIRVWMHIRQWFDDSNAIDRTSFDQMIVDAANGH